MPLLFSYGTLQEESVQLSTFGRLLQGQRDELPGFETSLVKIEDPQILAASGKTHHANVTFNGRSESRVSGTVFELTDAELAAADQYEQLASYKRVAAMLASGQQVWVYVDARSSMPIELDHTIVPSHHKVASAKLLAELLGVPWSETGLGLFSPVYVNDGLTLDFIETAEPFPIYHFCFRVSQEDFDAILGRIKAAGIKYRSSVRGPMDMQINTEYGGSMVYWNEPDGHQWEMLTVSYARQPA